MLARVEPFDEAPPARLRLAAAAMDQCLRSDRATRGGILCLLDAANGNYNYNCGSLLAV